MRTKFKNLKVVVIVSLILAMACFLLGFVRLSFLGASIEVSGFEFATTISLHEDLTFDEEDFPNPWLIGAFLSAISALGITTEIKEPSKKNYLVGAISAMCFLCLLVFRATFLKLNDMDGLSALYTIDYCSGWLLSTVLSAGAAITSLFAGIMAEEDFYNMSQQGEAYATSSPINKSEQCISPTTKNNAKLKVVITTKTESGEGAYWAFDSFPCIIGRDLARVNVFLSDMGVSRVHATVYIDNDAVMIKDETSTGGTFVNGKKITKPVELLTGDEVQVGRTTLSFEVSEIAVQTSAI